MQDCKKNADFSSSAISALHSIVEGKPVYDIQPLLPACKEVIEFWFSCTGCKLNRGYIEYFNSRNFFVLDEMVLLRIQMREPIEEWVEGNYSADNIAVARIEEVARTLAGQPTELSSNEDILEQLEAYMPVKLDSKREGKKNALTLSAFHSKGKKHTEINIFAPENIYWGIWLNSEPCLFPDAVVNGTTQYGFFPTPYWHNRLIEKMMHNQSNAASLADVYSDKASVVIQDGTLRWDCHENQSSEANNPTTESIR